MNRRIIVFARAPLPGACKTRLIPRLGARGAAKLHAGLARRALTIARAVAGARVELWCTPDSRHGFFLRCRRDFGVALNRQPRGDLGARMALALRADAGGIVIGTDCPGLASADLEAALAALREADVVLQPAEDGGYVLIGARNLPPGALRGIAWSSGRELAQTRRRLARYGLSVRELPLLWDVDTPRAYLRARRAGLIR